MSHVNARLAAHRFESVWDKLARRGYVLIDDEAIGLPEKFRTNFHTTYFTDFTMRHDEGDFPVDRKRARDVIRYQRHDNFFDVTEHDTITITDRADIKGKRDHRRIEFLRDRGAQDMVGAFLSLVPLELREPESTFGINLFRTFTDVVTKPHRDNERFVILYVLERVGGGAVSYLYRPEDVSESGEPLADPLLWHQLNPGEILIFDDERFFHGATPLIAPLGEKTGRRDAVVCTVDYRETYLAA
jgi:2OG-Fe dioxygenase